MLTTTVIIEKNIQEHTGTEQFAGKVTTMKTMLNHKIQ